jgi:hypothetical protein
MNFGMLKDEIEKIRKGMRHHAELLLRPGEKLSVGDTVTFREATEATQTSPHPVLDFVAGGEFVRVVLTVIRPINGPGKMEGVVHVEWNVPTAANWVS